MWPSKYSLNSFTNKTTNDLPWASLEAQTVKNLPAMQETQVRSLGWEDPLEKGMAIPSSILPWGNLMDTGQRRLACHSP